MRPDFVADVGNSFIKWSRCADGAVAEQVYLHADDVDAWQAQRDGWDRRESTTWAIAGVHPARVRS